MPLTLPELYVIQVFTNAVLYGAYCVLLFVVLYILLSGCSMSKPHRSVYLLLVIIMFLLTTSHTALLLIQAMEGRRIIPLTRIAGFLAILNGAFGDSILIWRVWVVWGHQYRFILLPCTILLLTTSLSLTATVPVAQAVQLAKASTALAVANTILCTSLFSGRLWYMQLRISRFMGSNGMYSTSRKSYNGVALVFVESGALYTLALILSMILKETKNEGLPIVQNMTVPLIGIIPTLIIVLAHLDLIPGSHAQQDYTATILKPQAQAIPTKPADVAIQAHGRFTMPMTGLRNSRPLDA